TVFGAVSDVKLTVVGSIAAATSSNRRKLIPEVSETLRMSLTSPKFWLYTVSETPSELDAVTFLATAGRLDAAVVKSNVAAITLVLSRIVAGCREPSRVREGLTFFSRLPKIIMSSPRFHR